MTVDICFQFFFVAFMVERSCSEGTSHPCISLGGFYLRGIMVRGGYLLLITALAFLAFRFLFFPKWLSSKGVGCLRSGKFVFIICCSSASDH